MLQSLNLGLMLMVMVIFRVAVFVLEQGDCNKVVSPLEVGQTDKPTKDVDGVLVDIGSEIRSWSKVGSVLHKKFSPG